MPLFLPIGFGKSVLILKWQSSCFGTYCRQSRCSYESFMPRTVVGTGRDLAQTISPVYSLQYTLLAWGVNSLCTLNVSSSLLVFLCFSSLLPPPSTYPHLTPLKAQPPLESFSGLYASTECGRLIRGKGPLKSGQGPGQVLRWFTSGAHPALRLSGGRFQWVLPQIELEARVHLHGSKLPICALLPQKSVSKAHSPIHWAHLHTMPAGP